MKKAFVVLSLLLLTYMQGSFFTNSRTVKAAYENETVTMRVLPANVTVKLGQPFSVNVTFENIPNTMPENGVIGCSFNLTWNSSILRGVSVQDVAFHAATPQNDSWNVWSISNEVSNDSAYYAYTWQNNRRAIDYGYAPFVGNETWASITFVSVGSGETDLHLSSIVLGSITLLIVGVGVDGKVLVSKMLAGDINQDGTVNSADVGLLSAAFGSIPNDSNWNPNADINNDGVVNILDAIMLANNFGRVAP